MDTGFLTRHSVPALLLAVLIASLAVGACGANDGTDEASPSATLSPTGAPSQGGLGDGLIAFTTALMLPPGFPQEGEASHVYVTAPDGSGLSDLGKGAGPVAWSPDGTKIAFAAEKGLMTMNADGSGRELVAKWQSGGDPTWSPEEEIVYCNFEGPDTIALVAVKPNGSGLRHVTPPTESVLDRHPVWTPDGRILFLREDVLENSSTLYSVAPDGSGLKAIGSPFTGQLPTSFSLSPDGKWILYFSSEQDGLVQVPADGTSGETVLLANMEDYKADPGIAIATSWSPDGSRIAFGPDATAFAEPGALYVMDADGTGVRAVSNVEQAVSPVWQP